MANDKPEVPQQRLGVPSRNPLPLSASQEAQVREIYYARCHSVHDITTTRKLTLSLCCPIAFAECAFGRTFTVSFACRDQHRIMNNCMKLHATAEENDAAREEWFASRMERHRERERKAKMAVAQEEFLREWWGLPEEERSWRKQEVEKLKQPERVGGMPAKDRRRGPEV
ncbi:hypothetical protein E4U35_006236 [Claviceps purpurea]|uniref:COX assembly mitochondrial protein n=1 Tax=Claviceps purpurea (strain 20.1) TaxID=1111077 RepID=M1VZ58_CLAP2|nr:hypothetical protein E4U28_004556 [Claviceps purpurea]CCE34642.1 uncharacterized protein CPUR_08576 [Claviceps purpurea 20.1]KAG6200333.1 hypothetical protein E4U35_006236 [Claviceps purpurea]KAG6266481.1 hypothetical protein E4U47_005789 [Claviceps purpurea]KAG6281424.1 hypothetical protein E4U48_006916 [Claviceps purpurea]